MNTGIYHLLKEIAANSADSVALAGVDRNPLCYGDLFHLCESMVGSLRAMGIERNDRVAIVQPNGPESATTFLAVASGATSAPLNPAYQEDEFRFYLSDLRAKALLIEHQSQSPARAVARELAIAILEFVPCREKAGFFELVDASAKSEVEYSQGSDVALVLHTSGTTARPKIVPLRHQNICYSACNIAQFLQLGPNDRCLNIMPLFHIHGLIGVLLSSLSAGASVVCTPGINADAFFAWLDSFSPTWYSGVPTMHQAILAVAGSQREIVARRPLRFIRSSSAALPTNVLASLEEVFQAPVIEAYGMTEASHQMTSNPLPPGVRKPGSVGIATGIEVAIMSDDGNLLPLGETGTVVIRGSSVTQGYENSIANDQAFANGWFLTGDTGWIDGDGYLFLIGRIKEIINRGGEKVAPMEVEEVLLSHSDIAEAVVFAISHPTLGEDVNAAVVLRDGVPLTESMIRQYMFSRIADVKIPSRVIIVDAIPKGPTGKIQRIGLIDRLADQLKAQFSPAETTTEVSLGKIWREVLGAEQLSIHDNFFALGGDSLLAAQVVSRIRTFFQVEVPITTVFRDPTLAGMAMRVEELVLDEIERSDEK